MKANLESDTVALSRAWPAYATIWRWHFYAGLFCIPFIIVLSITGGLYLFKSQLESLLDRPYAQLAMDGPAQSAAAQVAAALVAVPGSVLNAYELPATPHSAVHVLVGRGSEITRVYVHPQTLKVLRQEPEDSRPMTVIKRIHGTLLAGDRGSNVVELAASWTIVMILTGLFLWWPRKAIGLAGVLYPRLNGNRRVFWRDLHAVTGIWVSFLGLFLLLSGLPWAASWGSLFKEARQMATMTTVQQDWTTGPSSELAERRLANSAVSGGEHAGHTMVSRHSVSSGGAGRWRDGAGPIVGDYLPLDRLVATIQPLRLAAPVFISPPSLRSPSWSARSEAQNRPLRTDIVLDGATGAITSRRNFADKPLTDRIVGYGIALHEGQLFGGFNQALGMFAAASMLVLAVSAVVLWWRRRVPGFLGAPMPTARVRPVAHALIVLIILLGILLPFLGLTLLLVLAAERWILIRIPAARVFLGLEARQSSTAA